MAIDLLNRPSSGPDEDGRNPGQRHADSVFNDLTSAEHLAKDGSSGDIGAESEQSFFNPHRDKAGGGDSTSESASSSFSAGSQFTKFKSMFWGSRRRKIATTSGGTAGVLIGLFSFGSLFFAGPFEAAHIAQFLTQAHMGDQQDAEDGRMGRAYRYLRSGGQVGETRIGYLGSVYHKKMIADMEKIGLKPVYGEASIFKGFEIDTTHKDSPYHGMDEKAVNAALEKEGITGKVSSKEGKITISSKGYFGSDGSKRATAHLVKKAGYSGLGGYLRARILRAYGMATWHPLKRVDGEINSRVIKAFNEAREKRYKTGVDPAAINADGAQEQTTDADGKTSETPTSDADKQAASAVTADPDKASSVLKDIAGSKTGKIAGGVAAAQGIVCSLRLLGEEVGQVRYTQVVLPLIRMGTDAISTGSQVQSGDDINSNSVALAAQSFDEKKDGKIVSTWDQAESVQAEMGKSNTGVPATEATKGIGKGIPGWLAWSQDGKLGAFCSKAGQIIGGGISITLSVVSGGIVSTASGLVTGMVASKYAMQAAIGFLSGNAVNVAASGAEWGNDVNYGSRLASNAMALQMGGSALSDKETAVLDGERNAKDTADFHGKSLAYQIFNPSDRRTLAAKAIDNSQAIQPANLASTVGSMFSGLGSLLKLPASLFTKADAATAKPYDYGFAQFGFSDDDLSNSAIQDPYANAEAVAKILDGPSGQGYIDKASKCFGIIISKGEHGWQAVPPASATDPSSFLNVYDSKNYNADDCRDKGNGDWLKIRFFILDNGVLEGYTCFQGDDTSCEHDGVVDESTTAGSGGSGSGTPGTSDMSDDYASECRKYTTCTRQCVDFVLFRLIKHKVLKGSMAIGNGWQVVNTLAGLGYKKDHTPAVHAVVSWPRGGVAGSHANASAGHTAMVSQVNPDGSIVVEEYNVIPLRYDKRTIPAKIVPLLSYAHTEVDYK